MTEPLAAGPLDVLDLFTRRVKALVRLREANEREIGSRPEPDPFASLTPRQRAEFVLEALALPASSRPARDGATERVRLEWLESEERSDVEALRAIGSRLAADLAAAGLDARAVHRVLYLLGEVGGLAALVDDREEIQTDLIGLRAQVEAASIRPAAEEATMSKRAPKASAESADRPVRIGQLPDVPFAVTRGVPFGAFRSVRGLRDRASALHVQAAAESAAAAADAAAVGSTLAARGDPTHPDVIERSERAMESRSRAATTRAQAEVLDVIVDRVEAVVPSAPAQLSPVSLDELRRLLGDAGEPYGDEGKDGALRMRLACRGKGSPKGHAWKKALYLRLKACEGPDGFERREALAVVKIFADRHAQDVRAALETKRAIRALKIAKADFEA